MTTNLVCQDKYKPGDTFKDAASPVMTVAEVATETKEFAEDLGDLLTDLRQFRNSFGPGDDKAKARAIADKVEDALRLVRQAAAIARDFNKPA